MGSMANMTGEVKQTCREADLILGAERMLHTVRNLGKPMENLYIGTDIARYILEHPQYHKIAVLLSGDVGFYSGAKKLLQAFAEAGIGEERRESSFVLTAGSRQGEGGAEHRGRQKTPVSNPPAVRNLLGTVFCRQAADSLGRYYADERTRQAAEYHRNASHP